MPRLNTTGRPTFSRIKRRQVSQEQYGENWAELSDYVRRRDDYRCQAHKIGLPRCNNRFPPPFHNLMHAHHVIPLPRGRNHPSNLLTLCRDCHGLIHNKSFGKKISDKQKIAAKGVFKCQ